MSNKIQIGNITSGYRQINNGNQYEKYFSKPDVKDTIIIEDGEVDQTVDLMRKVVWKYIDDTKKIAPILKGSSIAKTCDNIWNFLYHHIQYRLDKAGVEQLRRPARSWYERKDGIDCDCFSIFVSSILTNLGIEHSFRITKYDGPNFQHVYVIVPINGTYHIIDPVLSQANYQKKYSQKKDFKMSLKGINVAVLSGETDQDLFDAVMGTNLDGIGFGSMSSEQELQAVYQYLIKTRNAIAQNPEMISVVEDSQSFLQMLDYAIKYWNTPKRDEALAVLVKNEERYNSQHGLSGIYDDDNEELLGRWFSRKKKKHGKSFFSRIKSGFKKVGSKLKSITKVVVRYNPLVVAARGGFLLAMKMNIKNIASKLKWGYASQHQASRKGINTRRWNQSKHALRQVESLFADKLQGTRSALKSAILHGKAGGLNGVDGYDNNEELEGLGIVSVAAAGSLIAAATPVIVTVMKILKKVGLMSPQEKEKVSSSEIKHHTNKLNTKHSRHSRYLPKRPTVKNQASYASAPNPNTTARLQYQDHAPALPRPTDTGNKLMNFVKKNPIPVAGAAAAVIGIGYMAFAGIKPKKSSLKGVGKSRKSTKKRRSTKSIKTITLK